MHTNTAKMLCFYFIAQWPGAINYWHAWWHCRSVIVESKSAILRWFTQHGTRHDSCITWSWIQAQGMYTCELILYKLIKFLLVGKFGCNVWYWDCHERCDILSVCFSKIYLFKKSFCIFLKSLHSWHKYIDDIFDRFKQNLNPYNPTGVIDFLFISPLFLH